MPSNVDINQAFQTLRVAYRSDIGPRFTDIQTQIKQGAGYNEIEAELASIRGNLEDLYTQVFSLLEAAQANDPQDAELITNLERSINTNRPQNLSVLAANEIVARENQARQDALVAEAQEFFAEATQGPGTASAGDIAAGSAGARDQLVQAPPTLPSSVLARLPTNATNALGTVLDTANGFPGAPRLPGANNLATLGLPVANTAVVGSVTAVASQPPSGSASGGGFDLSQPKQTYIYKATTCTSTFSKGKFEQELHGVLMIFPPEVYQQAVQPIYRGTQEEGDAGEAEARENWQRIPAQQQTPPGGDQTNGRITGGATSDSGETGASPVSVSQNLPVAGNTVPSNTGASASAVTDPQAATSTVSPAEQAAPTSGTADLSPVTQQPPRFDFVTGYVTDIPPGVRTDPIAGGWIYTQPNGEEVRFTANTNEALQARIRSIDTGTQQTFVDYDSNVGWVTKTSDGSSQTIVGAAPNPYEAPPANAVPPQLIARDT